MPLKFTSPVFLSVEMLENELFGPSYPVAPNGQPLGCGVIGPELIGWTLKMLGEIPQRADVSVYGTLGIVTTLEFFQHHFSKLGHKNLLVTQIYLPPMSDASP